MWSAGMRIAAALAALAAVTALGSCSGARSTDQPAAQTTSSTRDAQPRQHNADDVMFAQMMIPHHQQAVEMSAMVPSRSTNTDLLMLAKHISADQQAEIQTLQTLLSQWGQPVMANNGHGATNMTGMVDESTMNQLQTLDGAAFDTLWMRSMISHHQGAVMMAQTEIAHGLSTDGIHVAKLIVTAQQREIAYMNHLLSVSK
jgi:uncharacterized protein (DUF305 family)